MRRLLLSTLFCLFVSITAQADTFVILPNGELAFNTSFTTQGVFTCTLCSGSGTNSVVFGSGANTLTVTFTGVSTTIVVGGSAVPANLGQILVVATGSGFVFPLESNQNVSLLDFKLGITQTSPAAGTGFITFGTGPGGGTSLLANHRFSDYVGLPIGANPPGFSYTQIVYSFTAFTIPNINGTVDINASLVAIPEPMSLMLLGSGVGIMLGWARRRSTLK